MRVKNLGTVTIVVAVFSLGSCGESGSTPVETTSQPSSLTTFAVASVQVTPGSTSLAAGAAVQLTAVAYAADASVLTGRPATWSSSNPALATVTSSGKVYAVSPGIAVIQASVEGKNASATVTVSAPAPAPVASILVMLSSSVLDVGQTTQATAQLRDAAGNTLSGRAVTWTSLDPSIVTVSPVGVVTAVESGTTTIVATSEQITGIASLTVNPRAPAPVAQVTIVAARTNLVVGDTTATTVTLTDAQGHVLTGRTITFTSGNPAIATISARGVVTAVGAGTVSIQATSGGVTGQDTVVVTAAPAVVASVTVALSSSSVQVGATAQATAVALDASGQPITGRAVSWSISSGAGVASVTQIGVVTALSGGSATVRATIDGVAGDASLTVHTLTAVLLTPATVALAPGATQQFTVVGTWSDGSTAVPAVTYSATGGAITTGGLYTAGTTSGTFRVIATQQGGTKADTSIVTITAPAAILLQLVLSPASLTLAPAGTGQFTVAGTWSDGSTSAPSVTWSATGGTITTGGLYTAGATPGTYRVIATQQGGSKSDTSSVTVTSLPPTALALVIQPAGAVSGVPFTQQPVAELRNAQNQPVQQSGVVVTASKSSGTGTLSGPLTATTNSQGRAIFAGLLITGSGPHTIAFAGTGLTSVTSATLTLATPSLRSLATARGFRIGAAVRDSAFRNNAQYRQTLVTQYNSIVPEDATDFVNIHPGVTTYNFANADALVDFAQANGMTFHGNHLAWYSWIPSWVTNSNYSEAQIRNALRDHILTVVGRYRGRAVSWNAVNEPVDDAACWQNNCRLQPSFWLTHLGPEYIDSVFVWANRADPAAKLYLNDYRTEIANNKSDYLLSLAKSLKARGVPIHGVGFQVHLLGQYFTYPTSAQLQANFQRFADAGLDIRISEMDVMIPDTGGVATLATQATVYRNVLDACLHVPRCANLTTWGFTDKYSWVPSSFPGYGRALPFDVNYQTKAAVDSLLARLGRP